MATTLVIDGYNAINAIPEVRKELKKSLLAARNAIILVSKKYARSSGCIDDVRVVFDGIDKYRDMERFGHLKGKDQVFSRSGKGDRKVIDTVKKYSAKGKVVLASNDNYVRNNARAYGAAIIDVRDLAGRKSKVSGNKSDVPNKKIDKNLEKEITEEYRKELGI
jgi:predicted RNA-binding protein with PIN domain